MEDPSSLETHLRDAHVDYFGVFEARAGGGHPDKELVVMRGGVGALAKLARTETEMRQCRAEVMAYQLARALAWDDLVPVTVLREVPSSEGDVQASVQVLWPAYATAEELGLDESALLEPDVWRIAVLDALLLNGDRNRGNWGMVARTKLGLIDHGNSAISGMPGVSPFAQARRDHVLPHEVQERLEALVDRGEHQFDDYGGPDEGTALVHRAAVMLERGTLAVEG
jgi:hypothetical protein